MIEAYSYITCGVLIGEMVDVGGGYRHESQRRQKSRTKGGETMSELRAPYIWSGESVGAMGLISLNT